MSGLFASSNHIGEELNVFSIIPFLGILLSIAILPLFVPVFWHHNYGKISAFWAFLYIIPFALWKGLEVASHQVMHVILLEYLPFIILLFSLYTISGGIRIKGSFSGTPHFNTLLILIGTILASWMGTTGASILLIRPLIKANKWRKYKVHTVIFFIFLVANIGGALTPLGDPPLFLGFLLGIKFFWTIKIMFIPMCLISIMLITIYYLIDVFYFKKEKAQHIKQNEINESFGIEGLLNIFLL